MSSSLLVPHRKELITKLKRANLYGWYAILTEVVFIFILCFFLIDWSYTLSRPLISVVVIGIMVAPGIFGLLQIAFQNKKALEDLREDAQFGRFSKHDLINIVREVEKKMKIAPGKVQAYLTREKDLNASAIQLGLASLFPSLNAIYLNRATVHCLSREELAGVVAHEMAHNEKYYLLWDRFYLLHLIARVFAGLFLRQCASEGSSLEIFLPLGFAGAWEFLYARYRGSFSHLLEHLCDDAGAAVSGVCAAITAELKIAARATSYVKGIRCVLEQKLRGAEVSAKGALATLEETLPFGEIDEQELMAAVQKKLQAAGTPDNALSLKGFIHFLGVTESHETRNQLKEEVEKLRVIEQVPTHSIKLPLEGALSKEDIEDLVNRINAEPSKVLFPLESELTDVTSHPSVRKRILYLWKHREEMTHG